MSEDSGFSESPTLPVTGSDMGSARPGAKPGAPVPPAIGAYRILSHLGDGGFGAVYLAEQTHPVRRRVAVKVIKSGMDTPALVARFEAERQMLVMMDHPGVAKVFDAGVTPEGRPYVAMEYVAGEPISVFCENGRLGVDDRVRLMVKVCNAVHHAHMKGVIHRDLKPANILVELVDAVPSPRVIDFGVAKAQDRSLSGSRAVTEFGQMVGTPEYMPPEQARGGAVDVDTRADVYALGAVLYELLTGSTPLDPHALRRAGYAEMQRIIEQESPVLPSRRVLERRTLATTKGTASAPGSTTLRFGRIRRELDWIVMRCLEKDRARRYESAAALARDLERYLTDEPVEAGPPSMSYRAAKFVQRNKIAVAAAAFCVAVGIGALGVTSWALGRAITDRESAKAEKTKAVEARDEAEAVTRFLTGILESIEPENRGREVTVRQVLDDAARKLETDHKSELASPVLRARVRVTLGSSYLALGELEEAERHVRMGVEARMRELGPSSPATLRAQFNLAGVLYEQGKLDEAESLYAHCLDEWTRIGGGPDSEPLGAMNNLAQIAAREGRLQEAEGLQRRTIMGMEAELGNEHEHTLGARVNLGAMLRDQRRFKEAEETLRAAQESWRSAHGAEHPGTLLAMHNLGLLYLDSNRLDEAESMSRRLVEIRRRVLGPEHPDTIAAMVNLGLVLSRTKSSETERVYLEAWEAARRSLGEEHATTLTAGLNLLTVYEQAGWPASSSAAVERLVGTLRLIAAREGASESDLNASAWLLLTAKPESVQDPAAALKAATRACDSARRTGSRDLWQYLDTLALAYARTGAVENAVQTQREAIRSMPQTPDAQRYLGEMQDRLAEYEKAGK